MEISKNTPEYILIREQKIIECKNPENATTSVVISPQNLKTDIFTISKNIINIDKITKYMNLYPINPTKYGFVIAGLPLNMIYVANFPDKKVDADTDIEYPTTEILGTYSNELECYIVGKTTDEVRKMFQTMFIDIQSLGLKGTFTRTKTMIEFTIIIENKQKSYNAIDKKMDLQFTTLLTKFTYKWNLINFKSYNELFNNMSHYIEMIACDGNHIWCNDKALYSLEYKMIVAINTTNLIK